MHGDRAGNLRRVLQPIRTCPGLLGGPVDLAFVDGLHLFEQALRDVANVEHHSNPDGIILIHDCLPIDEATSTREQTTVIWSGDVWKVVVALRRYRHDLTVTTVDVEPTGLAIVSGLNPDNTVLFDRYDEIVDELRDLSFEDLQAAWSLHDALNVINALIGKPSEPCSNPAPAKPPEVFASLKID